MNIIILCKPKPIQNVVEPNQKIYDYMSKFFGRSKKNIIVKISPNEKIDQEDYFSKFMNENTFIIAFYVHELNGCTIQQTDSPIKKQTTITQYGYCSQENDEISQNISQINNSAKSFYEEKLEQINIITTNILSSSQNIEKVSSQIIQTNTCAYCMTSIEETVIETPCQHFFHSNCFTFIVENQIQQKEPTLNCPCKMRLNFRTLFHLVDKYEAESFKHRFIMNQLSALERNIQNKFGNEFRKCINVKSCNFFYLNLPFIQKQHQFCPNCLWHSEK